MKDRILPIFEIELIDSDAKMPKRARQGDAGFDVFVPKEVVIPAGEDVKIDLGWRCRFPSHDPELNT